MSANQPTTTNRVGDQPSPVRKQQPVRDVPGCIKYILLLLLLILLAGEIYSGEFREFPKMYGLNWLILLIKILLIIGLLVLIWVQRRLVCQITAPKNCAKEDIDQATGNPRLTVQGSASGTIFGHYTLELQGHPECTVTYPPGGGSVQVTNGLLGWIDTSPVSPGNYTVVLRVFPSGAGSPSTCTSDISILRAPVWIDKVGLVQTFDIGAYPGDTDRLRIIEAAGPGSPETAIGGAVSIEGGAYLEGCGKRMFEYSLEYHDAPYGPTAPGTTPPQPDAAGGWTSILSLQYGDVPQHPYTWSCGFLIGIPNYITNGILTRRWVVGNCSLPLHPLYATGTGNNWNTLAIIGPSGPNGRYTVRVREKHAPLGMTTPMEELFDAATVWIDNRAIVAKIRKLMIHGGVSLDVCAELSLSQFLPSGQADIVGHAWDPLILDPPAAPADLEPNDNFGGYNLQFKKDGGAWFDIAISVPPLPPGPPPPPPVLVNPRPVPNVRTVAEPADLDTDVLTTWDIVKALDAGPLPAGNPPPPYPKIFRGQRCAYLIALGVWDKTHVNDDGGHPGQDLFPFCIVNDLTNEPFPWP